MTVKDRHYPFYICSALGVLMKTGLPFFAHHIEERENGRECSRCLVLTDLAQEYKVRARLVPLLHWKVPRAPHDQRAHRKLSADELTRYFERRVELSDALWGNSIENDKKRDKAFMGSSFLKKVPKEKYMHLLLRSNVI